MNFYKHFLGDYARDTADLSLIEHGAYRVLLDHYYAQRGDMPADLMKLERVCKARSTVERQAVQDVANRFFPINGDGRRHNKRADSEIAGADAYAKAQAERAHMRWHSRGNPSHSHSQKEAKDKGLRPLSESSIPPCPQKELLALYAKHLPGLTQPRLWEGRRAESMRARWIGCAKKNDVWPGYASLEDGLAFWDKFFAGVASSTTLTDGIKRGDGSVWKPDLPWLLKAENFAKVIDGKYHG